ncbi:MAG: SUMF1/EgtB/PvdO family nonheme iron enzyme [Planctomycetota bacterium]|nr:SUMF1/EgtB/PvdO family nonheme iron enzyme [Planctomycetota bacterium]
MIRSALIVALVAPMLSAVALAADAGKTPATQPAVMTIPGTTVQFTMVKLPAGTVDIAIPNKEAATVELKTFWIGRTEVTWDEFDVFAFGLDFPNDDAKIAAVGKTHPTPPYGDPGYGHRASGYPVMSVHPQSAAAYCKWLSAKLNKKFRLPTEAEWEYACRAGETPVKLPESDLDKVAWYAANSAGDDGEPAVHPVAMKKANGFGLYDALGNVAEWTVADDGANFARGGSYKDGAGKVHCRARIPNNPKVLQVRDPQIPQSIWWLSDAPHIGFRIVMAE